MRFFRRRRRFQEPRDYQRYVAKDGNTILDCGITSRELDVRQSERRREMNNPRVRLVPVGPRVTEQTAREWEREWRCSPY